MTKNIKRKKKSKDSLDGVVNFMFEVGILSKTPRSGFYFLGSGEQSVAEHINRVIFIGYALAMLEGADVGKTLKMCLFHDLAEGRTSDLNYVHQRYVERNEESAIKDLVATIPFGKDVEETIHEYEERESKEALLTKDADNLELLLLLKEQADIGNIRAKSWMPSVMKRLKTEAGKKIGKKILITKSDTWWAGDLTDEWWVDRKKES